MNRRAPLLITSMIALPMLALLALGPTSAQAAVWNGWARCEITTGGSGYQQTDTHTWFVSNASGNTAGTLGSGSWQSAGRGNIRQGDPSQTLMVGEWAINGMSLSAQFSVTTTGGVVTIRSAHTTLKTSGGIVGYVQQTINNSARTPSPISATAWEWPFPLVQGSATGNTIAGTSSGNHTGIGWGYMQASGSTIASSCQWMFADGSIPNPPPTIPPEPPPVLPGTQPPPQQPPPAPSDPCQQYRVRGSGATQIAGLVPRSFREGERITVCGSQLSTAVLEDQFVDIASLPHLASPNTATFVLIGHRSLMALNPEFSKRGDRLIFTAGRLYERSELTQDYDVLIPVAPVPKTWTGEFALRLKGEAPPARGPQVRWMPR